MSLLSSIPVLRVKQVYCLLPPPPTVPEFILQFGMKFYLL